MAVKRGLNMGRGLEALIPQRTPAENVPGTAEDPKKTKKAAAGKPAKKAADKPDGKTAKKAAAGKSAGGPAKKASDPAAKAIEKKEPALAAEKAAEKPAKKAAPAKAAAKADRKPAVKAAPAKPAAKDAAAAPADAVLTLKIGDIIPNAGQPRRDFDEEAIAELAESIKEFGVLQPLLVQKKDGKYEIIAGERRWRAARMAGMKQVPAIIRDYTDRETFEISLIENLQRENLNPLEEAMAYRRLVEEFGMTQDAVAKRVSKSRTAVTNSLRLLKLEDEVKRMLAEGTLTMGHARALLALEDPEKQQTAAQLIVEGDLSVRAAEKLVKKILNPAPVREKARADEQLDAVYSSIEERLRRRTGTKVSIRKGHGNTGRIEIEYYSQEDLERIILMFE